jgi:hypothetical protein
VGDIAHELEIIGAVGWCGFMLMLGVEVEGRGGGDELREHVSIFPSAVEQGHREASLPLPRP